MTVTISLVLIGSVLALVTVILAVMERVSGTSNRNQMSQEASSACLANLKDIERSEREESFNTEDADRKRISALESFAQVREQDRVWRMLLERGKHAVLIATISTFSIAGLAGMLALYSDEPASATTAGLAQPGQVETGDPSINALRNYLQDIPVLETRQLESVQFFPQSRPTSLAGMSDSLPDVDTMIRRLAARLEKTPDDSAGWRTLGWSYFQTQKYADAVKAYARALKLEPKSVPVKKAYEEALSKARGTKVNRGRYVSEPQGSPSETVGIGGKVASNSSPDASIGRAPGPDATAVRRAEDIPPRERQAMIERMVDRLDKRLRSSPKDEEGWIRLMRSRMVLGQTAAAAKALEKALAAFSDETDVKTRIAKKARLLGVKAN